MALLLRDRRKKWSLYHIPSARYVASVKAYTKAEARAAFKPAVGVKPGQRLPAEYVVDDARASTF